MTGYIRRIVMFLIIVHSICSCVVAENMLPSACLPELAAYQINPDIEVGDELVFLPWNNDAPLDRAIRCVALSNDDSIAVLSSSSELRPYSNVISVYSDDGRYLYGYMFYIEDRRGQDIIFFSENNDLCYYATQNTAQVIGQQGIYVLDSEGNGIIDQYVIPSADLLSELCITEILQNNINVYAAQGAKCYVAYLENAILAVQNNQTGDIQLIYNHDDEYRAHYNLWNKYRRAFLIILLILLAGIIFAEIVHTKKQ